jgi:Carboxypeptidase regulatory-like domain
MPPGYYVKSVTYAQQEVRETGLTYVESSDPIGIVVSPNAATVSGVVHNDAGEPVAGATVVLAPPPAMRNPPRNFRTTTTDQTGYFAIGSLAPGDYTLFAWDDVQVNQYYDPDFLMTAESRGQKLTLEEGSQEVVNYEGIVAADSPPAPPAK